MGRRGRKSPAEKRPLPIPAEAFSRKEVVYDDLMGKIAARRGDPCYKKKYSPNSCQRKGADLNSLWQLIIHTEIGEDAVHDALGIFRAKMGRLAHDKDALHLFLKKFIEKVLIKGKIIADKPPLRQLSAVRNFKVSLPFRQERKDRIGSKPFDEGCGGFIFP